MRTLRKAMLSLAGAAVSVAGLAATPALAQDATLSAPEAFRESFTGGSRRGFGPRVQSAGAGVGRILVGVSLGRSAASAKIDLAAIRVAVPGNGGDRLCVRLSTSDGRYSATSEHPLKGRFAAPPKLGLKTKYAEALGGYDASELLIIATRATSCAAGSKGGAAPAIAATGAKELIAAINVSRGRPKAWLEKDGAEVTDKARCRRDEHAAKSHDCAINVASLGAGAYELVIDTGRLDGRSLIERTRLVLP